MCTGLPLKTRRRFFPQSLRKREGVESTSSSESSSDDEPDLEGVAEPAAEPRSDAALDDDAVLESLKDIAGANRPKHQESEGSLARQLNSILSEHNRTAVDLVSTPVVEAGGNDGEDY